MQTITVEDIRSIIATHMISGIIEYRRAKNAKSRGYKQVYGVPTEEEINVFIAGNKYYKIDLIKKLLDPGLLGYSCRILEVTDEWIIGFEKDTIAWTESEEWRHAKIRERIKLTYPIPKAIRIWNHSDSGIPGWLSKSSTYIQVEKMLKGKTEIFELNEWTEFEKRFCLMLTLNQWNVDYRRHNRRGGWEAIATNTDTINGKVKSIWKADSKSKNGLIYLDTVSELYLQNQEDEYSFNQVIVTKIQIQDKKVDYVRRNEYSKVNIDQEQCLEWTNENEQ